MAAAAAPGWGEWIGHSVFGGVPGAATAFVTQGAGDLAKAVAAQKQCQGEMNAACANYEKIKKRIGVLNSEIKGLVHDEFELAQVKTLVDLQKDQVDMMRTTIAMQNHGTLVIVGLTAIVAVLVVSVVIFMIIYRGKKMHSTLDTVSQLRAEVNQIENTTLPGT